MPAGAYIFHCGWFHRCPTFSSLENTVCAKMRRLVMPWVCCSGLSLGSHTIMTLSKMAAERNPCSGHFRRNQTGPCLLSCPQNYYDSHSVITCRLPCLRVFLIGYCLRLPDTSSQILKHTSRWKSNFLHTNTTQKWHLAQLFETPNTH